MKTWTPDPNDDTLKLQSLIDNAKGISDIQDGVYTISAPLIVHSETHDGMVKNAPIIWFAEGVNCGSISISNVHRTEKCAGTKAATIQIDSNVQIEKLTLRNIDQRFTYENEAPLIKNDGKILNLITDMNK